MAEEAQEQEGDGAEGSADGIALWRRLKEHRIAQWSLGYIAAAYGIQHAVTLTIEAMDWPHEIERASMILLALGFPLAIALAWYHGEKASRRISAGELSIVSVLLVIASLLFYVYVKPQPAPTTVAAAPAKLASASVPAKPASAPVAMPSGPSVAVLPFLNLSGDPKEEYFSDGMTEEITSALAKVKGLNVVARTSAFAFQGKNEDVRTIGKELSATDVIEGSVRKEGNEVRITAQLIRADTGDHLWTDSYDRELKDVFAVQEDIAQSIAGALQVPLGLKPGEQLVPDRTTNTGAYQDYLRALALYRARDMDQAITILEQAVKSDPSYAPASALLAQTYAIAPLYSPSLEFGPTVQVPVLRSYADKAEQMAKQALLLDPGNAVAHLAMAHAAATRLDWTTSYDQYRQALALDPSDPDILNDYAFTLLNTGYLQQALSVSQKLHSLEPFVPIYSIITAQILTAQHQYKAAIDVLQAVPVGGATGWRRGNALAGALAAVGRYGEAADALLAIPPTPLMSRTIIENAARLLRAAPAQVASPDQLPELAGFNWVYVLIGAPNRAFEGPERETAAGFYGVELGGAWYPGFAPQRKTERFKDMMRKAKLVDYWRAKGWPDLCHPVGADDFACN